MTVGMARSAGLRVRTGPLGSALEPDDAAPCQTCGHRRDQHSANRALDFCCLVKGCHCFWDPFLDEGP